MTTGDETGRRIVPPWRARRYAQPTEDEAAR
ncbi:MAG: hypothetical protein JWN69_360 [Alphaproteobacteria bacterium]|nr:hypothetical protein [Alphaproteobacteria bacterium]